MAVSSITGLVLAQSAFQTGALAAAVSAEQVMQPPPGLKTVDAEREIALRREFELPAKHLLLRT